MARMIKTTCLTFSLLGLTACGSGGDAPPSDLLFASTNPAATRSGLPYPDGSQTNSDLTADNIRVRLMRKEATTEDGVLTIRRFVTDETVSVENRTPVTMTIDGERIELVNLIGFSADGTRYNYFVGNEERGVQLDYGNFGVFVSTNNLGEPNETITWGVFAAGFETNPDFFQTTTGEISYSGQLDMINVTSTNPRNDRRSRGSFTLTSDLSENTVSGVFEFPDVDGLAPLSVRAGDVTLEMRPTAIVGNGFAGENIDVTTCTFAICSDAGSVIAGQFYGPSAEEVSGIIDFDVIIGDPEGNSVRADGTGFFLGQIAESE